MASLRVGLAVARADVDGMIAAIVEADRMGIATVWSNAGGASPDPLTIFAAAAVRTERVKLGTAIVPIYPRDPIVMASQALALEALAPGRLRLGIGTSHRSTVEGVHGITMGKPLTHLREYLTALRGILWDGKTDFEGEYYRIHVELPTGTEPPKTPLPISTLRLNAYRLAGELADGAISWVTPVQFLVEQALPALREGAAKANRPSPPLIGHIPVAVSSDRAAVRRAARARFAFYATAPFYQRMFADAGFPVGDNAEISDALLDHLIVTGTPDQIRRRLEEIQTAGVDELLVMQIPIADDAKERSALLRLLTE